MTNPDRNSGCLGYCGDKTYQQIGYQLHLCYDNKDPQLRPWQVEEIHQRWTRIGRLAKAGRL
jgi:hypothetical protein